MEDKGVCDSMGMIFQVIMAGLKVVMKAALFCGLAWFLIPLGLGLAYEAIFLS